MEMSDYLENKLADHSLGTAAYTKPTNVYLALLTADPTDANTGTEVTGGGYARQLVTFAAATGGVAATNVDAIYTNMPAATVTHAAIYDALTGGNLLYYTPLNSSQTVNAGNTFRINSGQATVQLT